MRRIVLCLFLVLGLATPGFAASCGKTGAGYDAWKKAYAAEARAQGVGPRGLVLGIDFSPVMIRRAPRPGAPSGGRTRPTPASPGAWPRSRRPPASTASRMPARTASTCCGGRRRPASRSPGAGTRAQGRSLRDGVPDAAEQALRG